MLENEFWVIVGYWKSMLGGSKCDFLFFFQAEDTASFH